MKGTIRRLFLLLLMISLAACSTNQVDPVTVVEEYFGYWNTEDVDGIMSIVADEPEIEIDRGTVLTDRASVRASFENLFRRTDFQIEISDFEVDGNTVSYNYEIFVNERVVERGRSQAVIEDGKIKREEYIGPFREPNP